jgi:hypothetical protein
MRGAIAMSASIIECSKHRVNDIKFDPSRSRMLKAMKANTKGMHAIHAARRNFQVGLSRKPRSIVGSLQDKSLDFAASPAATPLVPKW